MSRIKTLQDIRAFKAFVLMIIIATAFIVFAGIGVTVGMKGLIDVTISLFYAAFCHCMSFTVCAGTEAANFWNNFWYHLQIPKAIFFWIGLGVLTTGVLKAVIKALTLLLNDRRFLKNISEASLDDYQRHRATLSVLGLSKSFVLFRDDSLNHVFTLGLWKPKIYMSIGTYSCLTDKEFLSAISHEDYHRRHKDPLRLFVVILLGELLFFLPISNYFTKVFLDAKEKAADDNAVYASDNPLELASAIVKIVKSTPSPLPSPFKGRVGWGAYLANSVSGMAIVEERVRRLIEPGLESSNNKPSRKTVFFTMALCVFFFGAIFVNGIALYAHKEKIVHCVSNSCSMKCSSSHQEANHAAH